MRREERSPCRGTYRASRLPLYPSPETEDAPEERVAEEKIDGSKPLEMAWHCLDS